MMTAAAYDDTEVSLSHPIETIEQLVIANDWPFERPNDDEIAIELTGRWGDYRLFFMWRSDVAAVHFTCAFDLRIPESGLPGTSELIVRINEKLWLGHFDIWLDEGLPLYRHTQLLRGSNGLTVEQAEDLIETAITECERFHPAFKFVLEDGRPPELALADAMIEVAGEA
jgi:hypothetical protein